MQGTRATIQPHGQSGNVVSSYLAHIAGIADRIAIVRTVQTGNGNHSPAMVMAHTGSIVPGRPSLGAWYALAALRNFQTYGDLAAHEIQRTLHLIAEIDQALKAKGAGA